MFICNVCLKNNTLKKASITFLALLVIIVFITVALKFYKAISTVTIKDTVDNSVLEINSLNYTSILKDAHENVEKYVGKKVKFVGFVYRLYDFNENQFVLAREMILDDSKHAVVVGFLSECDIGNQFKMGSWVEIEGVIEKGNYHGDIPVIKIQNIKETTVPSDEYVYPPDGSYISSEI
ncbi:MAG: hypothetical protein K6B70_02580 [Clostridia bacterium]|nr:hypothetical protein [Clostridia bacterium]